MEIEDLIKKTLEGIEECEKRIKEYQNLINYWRGYQDCFKAFDLHFKMEDIKKRANEDIKE